MATSPPGVSALTKVEAVFRNPALYALAERIPKADRSKGGRPRLYPDYLSLAFEALISVYESARQVESELAHPIVWELIRRIVLDRFPDQPELHLPAEPIKRHHYAYLRNRYLVDPDVLSDIGALHRTHAAHQAQEIGLFDPQGPGSFSHPDLSRVLHADGKVLTPLYTAKPGEERVDRETGEVRGRSD